MSIANWTPLVREGQDYDVIVVGGGIAGVSAALQARRCGARVLVVEKSVVLGGLATLGLIVKYLPLCDGRGTKVTRGIPEELMRLAIRYGYGDLPPEWYDPATDRTDTPNRCVTHYNAPAFIMAMDELMETEGIDVLFDTVFLDAIGDASRCEGLVLANKAGVFRYGAGVVIDTTGEAEVLYRLGVPCEEGSNITAHWALTTSLDAMKRAVKKKSVREAMELTRFYLSNSLGDRSPEAFGPKPQPEPYDSQDPTYTTRFVLEGRRILRDLMKATPRDRSCILSIPGMPEFRTIRRIKGLYELTEADDHRRFEDSVGCCGDFRKRGPVYELPYRILVAPGVANVITAGRSVSASGGAWDVVRVIPPASATGQAAGAAAALCLKDRCDVGALNVGALQKTLRDAGVLLHILSDAASDV